MKIAALGDLHIPSRSLGISEGIKEKLLDYNPDLILCTGDLTDKNTLNELKEIAETKAVQGNMDKGDLPREAEQEVGNLKIVLIHGDQVFPRGNKDKLRYIAEEKEADIIISGHTHKLDTEKVGDKLLLNPGSATGAWSGGRTDSKATFLEIEVEGNRVKIKKIYEDREEVERYGFN